MSSWTVAFHCNTAKTAFSLLRKHLDKLLTMYNICFSVHCTNKIQSWPLSDNKFIPLLVTTRSWHYRMNVYAYRIVTNIFVCFCVFNTNFYSDVLLLKIKIYLWRGHRNIFDRSRNVRLKLNTLSSPLTRFKCQKNKPTSVSFQANVVVSLPA